MTDPINSRCYKFCKRGIDIIVSTTVLLASSPLLFLIALLIKISSPGPILYRQKRYTAGRKSFWIYKFRTMPVGVERIIGPVWAEQDDPRSTKIGLLLRHWHIDELPQLINVLKGEMSIVGPRPERPYFVEHFEKYIPDYVIRHRVKPGLTGWAQVHGYRGDTSIQMRAKYDRFYIENWSLFFDITILLKTAFALNGKKPPVQSRTFSHSDSCLQNSPFTVPTKKA